MHSVWRLRVNGNIPLSSPNKLYFSLKTHWLHYVYKPGTRWSSLATKTTAVFKSPQLWAAPQTTQGFLFWVWMVTTSAWSCTTYLIPSHSHQVATKRGFMFLIFMQESSSKILPTSVFAYQYCLLSILNPKSLHIRFNTWSLLIRRALTTWSKTHSATIQYVPQPAEAKLCHGVE